jgi:RTX calcium-binding nonapeptide repeat (4 copies)
MRRALLTAALALAATPAVGQAATYTFIAPNPIAIPGQGAASPYPATIKLERLTGTPAAVQAAPMRIRHDFPEDLDIVLVSPAGQTTMLMSDVCQGVNVVWFNVTYLFGDAAGGILDPPACLGPEDFFRPTNFNSEPNEAQLPPPAPPGLYGNTLAPLASNSPNGVWRLFVADDSALERGRLKGGWALRLRGAQTSVRCAGRTPHILGTARSDVLVGTDKRDVIAGLGGNDTIKGAGKRDRLCGNGGKDELVGGEARDRCSGGAGRDRERSC